MKDALAVFFAVALTVFLAGLLIGTGGFCWGFGQGLAQALFSL